MTPSVNAKVRSPGLRPRRKPTGFKVGDYLNNDNSPISHILDKSEAGDKLNLTDRNEDSTVNRLGTMLGKATSKMESDYDLRDNAES